MRSIDGTDLALAVATVASEAISNSEDDTMHSHVYILYCQGLPRLPVISGACACVD